MKNKSLILLMIATLPITSCTLLNNSSSENNDTNTTETENNATDTTESENNEETSQESSDDSSTSSQTSQNEPSKTVEFRLSTLSQESIIPLSYTSSGVELELEDMNLFANYITYDYFSTSKILESTGDIFSDFALTPDSKRRMLPAVSLYVSMKDSTICFFWLSPRVAGASRTTAALTPLSSKSRLKS